MTNNKPDTKIIAVYGYLGSGKTTVMMSLAKKAVVDGVKAAIVVNEAGKVPVDGKMLEVGGLPVKELFGGCICCAAIGDFTQTLKALLASGDLNYIFIEPSGMANAEDLFGAIEKYVSGNLTKLLILDGARMKLLRHVAWPLISGQISVADVILLNKADLLDEEKTLVAKVIINAVRDDVVVHQSIAKEGVATELLESLL
jgi:G3E family GTPase